MEPASPSPERPPSRFLTVGATRVHYTVEGRGPTVLLLHGLFASLDAWDGWAHELAGSFRVVRVDLPGFGGSERMPSDDYSPEYALELLDHLTHSLELTTFHLVGGCLGGFLAWYYAANRPERVSRLILLSPLGYEEPLHGLFALCAARGMSPLTAALFGTRLGASRVARTLGSGDGEFSSSGLAELRHAEARRGFIRLCRQLRRNSKDRDLSLAVHRLRTRTLLMWGERDAIVPVRHLEVWRRALPNAEWRVYPGAGHLLMTERAEQTAADAYDFLTREYQPSLLSDSGELAVSELLVRGA